MLVFWKKYKSLIASPLILPFFLSFFALTCSTCLPKRFSFYHIPEETDTARAKGWPYPGKRKSVRVYNCYRIDCVETCRVSNTWLAGYTGFLKFWDVMYVDNNLFFSIVNTNVYTIYYYIRYLWILCNFRNRHRVAMITNLYYNLYRIECINI